MISEVFRFDYHVSLHCEVQVSNLYLVDFLSFLKYNCIVFDFEIQYSYGSLICQDFHE